MKGQIMSVNLMEASNQWATRPQDQRFETLAALRDSVHSRRLRSRSVDIDCGRTEAKIDPDSKLLTLNGTITPCEPTHWSFGQLSTLIKAPASYLRSLNSNPQLLIDNLNHGLKNGRDTVKFMTIASEEKETNTLQAVTSTTYGRIWDADCVDCVGRIVERTGGKFYNPKAYCEGGVKGSGLYASDRDVFMFMIDGGSLLDVGPRAQLNRGFFLWNSETGARSFGLMTFLFNVCCGNHIVWGAQDITKYVIRHTEGGPARFDGEAAPKLLEYCNRSASADMDAIKRAQDRLLVDAGQKVTVETVLDFASKAAKFTRPEISSAIDFAKSEEGDCRTVWHLVQGLTAYARGFDYVDSRIDLETRAGKILNLVA
jgi:hypothetical protein